MKKKKVLHIVESFASGVFSFLIDLVNETNDDYEIVIAYGERKETQANFKEYFADNIRFIKVENFTRSINPIKDLKAFFEIKKIIKDENPDIIHLHSSKAGFIGRFAGNGRKKKMLYNPHGFSFLMQDESKIKRTIYWLIEKIAAFRKCTIVGCSKGEYEEALKLSKNAVWINNTINLQKIDECISNFKPKEIDFDNLKICTVGRINISKNPKLFNAIAEKFPEIKFTWIGEGELRSELKSENIFITGWKEKYEVLKILNENDIFILTSFWEGLPISLLDAMYMKKLCIVSNCIGNRDVINGTNGFVCDNLEEFEDVISKVKVLNIDEITNQANDDIINIYNTKIMIEKYLENYNK